MERGRWETAEMRVLCSTTAGEGHFGPLRVLAHACWVAGHEVRVAAPASFAGTVQRAGLDHVPFAEPSPEAKTLSLPRSRGRAQKRRTGP